MVTTPMRSFRPPTRRCMRPRQRDVTGLRWRACYVEQVARSPARLRLIDAASQAAQPTRVPGPRPGDEALDAYSRTVTAVAERLRHSVANLGVLRRTRRGRAQGG